MRKDVQLIIRAKDEAGRAVDSITGAINTLSSAQDNLTTSGQKTDSALGQLGAVLGQLDRELKGFTATERISSQFESANAASARLERSVQSTTQEYARLSAELNRASFASDRLAQRSAGAAAAQDRSRQSLQALQENQKALTAEVRRGTTERNKLARAEARLTTRIDAQAARVDAARQKFAGLSAEIAEAENPTARLVSRLGTASAAVERQEGRLTGLRNEAEQTRNAISTISGSLENFEASLTEATAKVSRQESVLGSVTQNLKELRTATSVAAREETRLDQALDKTADSLARQRTQLGGTEEGLTQLAFAADRAQIAMDKLANDATRKLRIEIAQQARATRQARTEWESAQASVAELATRMRSAADPSERLSQQLDAARISARNAKNEFTTLRNSVGELRQIANGGGGFKALGTDIGRVETSVASLTARNQQFAAAQQRANTALQQLRATAQQTGSAVARVGIGTLAAGRVSATAAGQTDRLSAAYRRLQGDTRKALSFTQRLRGEVLSLVASYAGFFAAVQGIDNVVDAFQTLEGAASRLNVVFQGDQRAVAEELDFLRRTADRLGIEFGTLAQEYTKFAVATQGTNLEGENTRKIFTSVAEAARVNKTSTEDLQGVFVALTQIVSKGTVSMEELRQQLGDRLPGALQIMGAGLGFGTDRLGEFIKAIENGEISSDALISFADELDRRFGSQLPAALETTTTEIGKFQNQLFQTLLSFGEAGFIESFTGLLQDLTATLQSADFQAFLSDLSAAAAVLVDILAIAVRNFDSLVLVGTTFVGLKLVAVVTVLTTRIGLLATATSAAQLQAAGFSKTMAATAVSTAAASAGASRATVAFVGLSRGFRALLASTGPVGIALLAASTALGFFVTSASDAQEAASELTGTVDDIKNAYEQADGSVEKFDAAIEGVSTAQARQQLLELNAELLRLQRNLQVSTNAFGLTKVFGGGGLLEGSKLLSRSEGGDEAATQLIVLRREFQKLGDAVNAEDISNYRKALNDLSDSTNDDFLTGAISNADKMAQSIQETKGIIDDTTDALRLTEKGGFELQQTLDKLRRLGGAKLTDTDSGEIDKAEAKRRAATRQRIADQRFEVEQQKLINAGLEDQARQEKVIRDARRVNPNITDGQLAQLVALSDELAAIESAQRKVKLSADITRELNANADAARFELEQVGKTNDEREVARAIRQQELALAKEGLTLGEEQIAQIRQTVALLQEAKSQEAVSSFREDLSRQIADKEFELELRDKEIIQRETAKALREAEQKAQEAGTTLTDAETAAIEKVTRALFAKAAAEDAATKARERASKAEASVSNLQSRRDSLAEQFESARTAGATGTAEALRGQIANVNQEMLAAIGNARAMWQAIGGEEAATAIEKLNVAEIQARAFANVADDILIDWAQVGQLFATGLSNAVDKFSERVANGENAFSSALLSFREFASDFLRQIAQMILQQLFLNAISGFTGAIPGLGSTGVLASVFHEGGIAGQGSVSRAVSPSVFANASKFHEGGLPGLSANEVPAILEKNEEVLTADDPRNILNGGGSGGGAAPVMLKNVNVFDPADIMEQALRSPAGEQVMLNFISDNPSAVRGALET